MNKRLFVKLMFTKSEKDFLNININSDINGIVESDVFSNTVFLWSIFNCNKLLTYLLLKYKEVLNLDINKPSMYGQQLSPLEALILKGQYRCGEYEKNNLIEMLLSNKEVDMYYIDAFDLDSMSLALFFYDLDVVMMLLNNGFILRDRHKFILFNYYKHNITPDFIKFLNKFKGSLVGTEEISYIIKYKKALFNKKEIENIFDIKFVESTLLYKPTYKYIDLYCLYKLNIDNSKYNILKALQEYYKNKRFNIIIDNLI